jgi:hypothetical protein
MKRDSEVWEIASIYAVQSVVRPEETRDYLIRMLDVHRLRLLESMKMEIPVIAEDGGVLKELRVAPGVAVTEHQVVALIEA